jgi:hypothetical protein
MRYFYKICGMENLSDMKDYVKLLGKNLEEETILEFQKALIFYSRLAINL